MRRDGRIQGIPVVETELISVMAKLLFLPGDVCSVYCFSGNSPTREESRIASGLDFARNEGRNVRHVQLPDNRTMRMRTIGFPPQLKTYFSRLALRRDGSKAGCVCTRRVGGVHVTFKRYCRAATAAAKFSRRKVRETMTTATGNVEPPCTSSGVYTVVSGTTPGRLSICHR